MGQATKRKDESVSLGGGFVDMRDCEFGGCTPLAASLAKFTTVLDTRWRPERRTGGGRQADTGQDMSMLEGTCRNDIEQSEGVIRWY